MKTQTNPPLTLTVSSLKNPQRIDKWLSSQLPNYSRQTIQDLIDKGSVLMNGKPLKKKDLVIENAKIFLYPPENQPHKIIPQDIPINIIYEDHSILVINKPKGLVVHPGAGNLDQTLVNGLVYHLDDFKPEEGDLRPGIVHRLDKDTSGVMIIAKTKEAHFKLAEQFSSREIKKTYLAITIGKPQGLYCDLPIKRHPTKRQQMTVDAAGKPAVTSFEILHSSTSYALVKAKPITGRTHQIRVHLKHLNAPIFADSTYGRQKKEELGHLQMLHAFQINFVHPITLKELSFNAAPPEDMLDFIYKELKIDFSILEQNF